MIAAQPAPAVPQPFQSASLYVGDLLPEVTEATLWEYFNRVGPVASIRICRDSMSKRSLGYGYVNFHNVADAERAIDTMNFTDIDVKNGAETKTRPCRIMWSQRDPSLRKSGVGNVFVKNLHPNVDNKALYDIFSVFGNILSCKVITDENGQGQGRGYVHYESAESATEAISKLNGSTIEDRTVQVLPFVRRQDRASVTNWTNVYLKNFPKSWTENNVAEIFSKFGEIQNISIAKDNSSGFNRGFGFVNFKEHTAADAAVKAFTENPFRADDVTLYVGRFQRKSERVEDLRRMYLQRREEFFKSTQNRNLFVKNIADDVTDQEFQEEFARYGKVLSCRLVRDEKGVSKGFGYVLYETPAEATNALNNGNNTVFKGKPLYINYHQSRTMRDQFLHGRLFMNQPYMYSGFAQMRGGAPMMRNRNQRPAYPMPQYNNFPAAMQGRRGYPVNRPGVPRRMNAGQPRMGGPNPNMQRRGPGPMNAPVNRQVPHHAAPVMMNAPQPMAQPAAPVGIMDHLANVQDLQAQKNMIGEKLYYLIAESEPQRAGKITGMLLEMEISELLHLLETPEALQSKVQEALMVLHQHETQQ